LSFVRVDALILALVFSDVGRVEKVGEQNKVRKVDQHAEVDVFLCLIAEDAILHLNMSVGSDKATDDHL